MPKQKSGKVGAAEILSGGEKKEKTKKKQKHKETRIEHHPDGSHTVRHVPVSDGTLPPGPDVSYAAKDLDGVHDGLEENLGEPNQDEASPQASPPQTQGV